MYFDVKPESVSRPQSGVRSELLMYGVSEYSTVVSRQSDALDKMLNGMNGSLLQINGAHQLAAQHMLMHRAKMVLYHDV